MNVVLLKILTKAEFDETVIGLGYPKPNPSERARWENHRNELLEQQMESNINDVPLCFQVWIWSKAKFINRKFLMEELYQCFLDGEDSQVAQEDDPFWDPVEVVHLGSAHIWLQSLAYCMKYEEQVEFLNCDGLEEAVLHIHINPCSPTGQWVSLPPPCLVLGHTENSQQA